MARGRSSTLKVLMNGQLVGHLRGDSRGVLTFAYTESWLSSENRRPISLSMPLAGRQYSGHTVENFFDNLLPDSQPIRSRLQARIGAESSRCFDLLTHIGRDCVGALQLLPEAEDADVQRIQATPVTESQIETILQNYRTMPLGVDMEADFRISIAGAQEKTAFLFYANQWHRPQGATPTSHLFKLPIGKLGQSGIDLSESVENEWLCHQLLKAFGLPVAKVEMASFGSQKVLVVERFDRKWAADGSWLMRLPQEDMCQATGTSGNLKYESDGGPGMSAIMDILLGSADGYSDRRNFLKTQLLYWMLGAIDGHAKNFSIVHLRGGMFRLTPLYDVISVYPIVAAKQIDRQQIRMAMAVLGKNRHYRWNTISRRHWLETAGACRFPREEMSLIIDECCDLVDTALNQIGAELPTSFPHTIAEPIFSGLATARNRLKLIRAMGS